MNKKLLFGILAVAIVIAGWWLLFGFNRAAVHSETVVVHTGVSKIEKISVWQFGSERIIEQSEEEYTKLANDLIPIIEKANLQGKCAIFEGDIALLRSQGKIVEVNFKEPVNITISQWIRPEERNHTPTTTDGYRILTNVGEVLFVLEGRYEGHILTKGADKTGYGCWAIGREGTNEIDKRWVDEVNKIIGGIP